VHPSSPEDWELIKFSFDADAHDEIREATSKTMKATAALLRAARHIRNQEPLPEPLRDWIASALEAAGHKETKKDAATSLAEALGLRSGNRPEAGDWLTIGKQYEYLVWKYKNSTKALGEIVRTYKVSEGTAKRYRTKYRKVSEERE
jgi:hypothetical protein